MNLRKTITSGVGVALTAAALASAIPSAASAQQPYAGCTTSNGAGTGAVIGGLGGAVAGNQLSARGRHTENTLIGGVLGAVAGAVIGGASHKTDCSQAAYAPPPPRSSYYDDRAPPPPPRDDRAYNDRYDDRGYDNRGYDDRAYDRRSYYDDGAYAPPPPPPPPPVYVEPAPVYVGPPVVYYGGPGYYPGYRHWRGW